MKRSKAWQKFTSSLIAGLTGTSVIMVLQALGQKVAPEQMPPLRQHPGDYMVEKAERLLTPEQRAKVPRALEKTAEQMLGVGYGLTFGVIFGMLRRKDRNPVLEGAALGLAAWAVGYLGWLPATGIMRPITRQRPVQVAGAVLSHIAYGTATAASLRAVQRRRRRGRPLAALFNALR